MLLLQIFDLINNKPSLEVQKFDKKFQEKKQQLEGCLLKPQSKLLPHAKCSIVSSGKLLFVSDGINVHKIK